MPTHVRKAVKKTKKTSTARPGRSAGKSKMKKKY